MATGTESPKTPQIRGDRGMLSASDDNAKLMKEIQNTHVPDHGCEFDVKPVLDFIKDILLHASTCVDVTQAQPDALNEKALQSGFSDKVKLLEQPINKISYQISCKYSDANATTVELLKILSSYSWDAKVVIALATFAGSYSEFWLLAKIYQTYPFAKSVALVKQLPDIEIDVSSKLKNLVAAMLKVTDCIVELKKLSSQIITPDTDHIPTAVYWTIMSVVTCASHIMNVIGVGNKPTAEELSILEKKINDTQSLLQTQLDLSKERIEKQKRSEAYRKIKLAFKTTHIHNTTILKALIYAEDGEEHQLPLFNGSTKTQVSIDSLGRKHVLLLISELDSSHEEIEILKQMYSAKSTEAKNEYEVLWFPVVDGSAQWDNKQKDKFEEVKNSLPWHSVSCTLPLQPAVIKYMKKVWDYNKKPLVVVLDPSGRVVNPNAIHMMCIWQNKGFPFTSEVEVLLWEKVTWTFELLVEPLISTWIKDGKHICIYGGTKINGIREFTDKAKEVAGDAGIQLEMLYVGKRNAREIVRKNNADIEKDHRGNTLSEENLNRFWVTLECMWHSKMRHCKSLEYDAIMTEITTVLSFDGSDEGWAVICDGSAKMAKAKGDAILSCLKEFDEWKDGARQDGFVSALNKKLEGLQTEYHCNCLILAGTSGDFPWSVICTHCKDPMEKFIMYRCCKD